ncbi:MAG: hypothetical protein JXR30_01665 [Alphaproteobacteria bacterium]|nr:hypothetical protein [Alphaproteobacteria bacterium]
MLIRLRNLLGYILLGAVAGYICYNTGYDFGQKYVAVTKSALLRTLKKTVDHVQDEAKRAVGRAQAQAKQSLQNLKNAANQSKTALVNSAKQSGKDLESAGKGMLNTGNIFGLVTGQKSIKDIEKEAKDKVKAEEKNLRNSAKAQEDVLKAKIKAEEDRLKAEMKNLFDVEAVENAIKNDVISALKLAVNLYWDLLLYAILSLFVLIACVYLIVKNVILIVLISLGKTTIGSAKLVAKSVKKKKNN